jgi:phosphatidyl-myo-inositol dimannoside synthase
MNTPPLRILLVSPFFPPARGGIERTAGELARALSADGNDLHVVAGEPAGDAAGLDAPSGVQVSWSANDPPGGRKATFALNRRAAAIALKLRPDVILAMHTRAAPAARLARYACGARMVLVIHAKEVPEQPRLAHAAVRWADAVVAVSAYSRELALGSGAQPVRVTTIHPGVTLPATPPPALSQRPGPPTIVTVARLDEPEKGHDVALRALAMLRERGVDARWVMVGDGRLRGALEWSARSLGVDGAVSFVGAVSDAQLAQTLDGAHAYCMLARSPGPGAAGEGFGIVFVEAGAHGLPVVAGKIPGVVDAVADGDSGLLIDSSEPAAAADALERVLTDPDLAARLAAAGAQRAAQLTWDNVAARYERLIGEVVAQPRRARVSGPGWLVDLARGGRV